ncbi:MAG: TIGR02147 family protein [Myxococcota bacterium]|nr:TIGR02147 family protein [Myxococcota bacterium]
MSNSIYHFINYRNFLQHWFDEKKKENSRYSHRLFSRLMQQSSPSFLRDIIDGRRNITIQHLDRFEKTLTLDEDEFSFFVDMVTLDQSKDDDERRRAYERIASAQRKHSARLLEGESYQYILRWECPAIRELALRPDFQYSSEWISQALIPNISEARAKEALAILADLQMLIQNEDGSITLSEGTLATPVEVLDLAAQKYHQEMLRLASEAVERFPPDERHLMGLTVSIPKSLIPIIKKEVSEFAFRMLDMCDSNDEVKDQTCQVNFQFFPLSNQRKES